MKKIFIFIIISACIAAYAQETQMPPVVVDRQTVLRSALQNNNTYLAAIQDKESARFSHRASWSEFLPELTFSGGISNSSIDGGDNVESQNTAFTASYNIFNGFRSYHSFRSTQLNMNIATQAELETLLQTIRSVNTAYENVLRTEYLLKSAETSLESAELVLNEAELKLRIDLITRAELYTARADRERAYSSFLDAQTVHRNAVLELGALAGMDLGADTKFAPEEREFQLDSLEYYMNRAFENNTQLQQSYMNRDLASRQYKSAYSGFLPSIDLSASRSWYDEDNTPSYNVNKYGITATWRLFSGFGDVHTAIAKAKALNSAELRLAESRTTLTKQVNMAYMEAASSFDKVSSARAFVAAAQENYTAMQEMFRLGRVSLRDTVDARKTLEDAQASLAEAHYAMVEAFENLAVLTATVILPE